MKTIEKFTRLLLVLTLGLGLTFTSCSKDEDETPTVEAKWTLKSVSTDVMINDTAFVDYLVAHGANKDSANADLADIQSEMNMTGTIEFKADGTFAANWVGEDPESGTWTISADNKILTIMSTDEDGDPESMIFDVTTLTMSELAIVMKMTQIEDMNEDGKDDTMKFEMSMSFTK